MEPKKIDKKFNKKLVNAIINEDTVIVEKFLIKDIDIYVYVKLGKRIKMTPLELAIRCNAISMVKFLLERKVDVNKDDGKILYSAVLNQNLYVVKLLIEHGADIHVLDNMCIKYYAARNDLEMCSYLIDKGANLEVAINHGNEKIKEYAEKIMNIKSLHYRLENELFNNNIKENFSKLKI